MGQGETSGEHFWERKVSRTLPLTPILFRLFHQSYQSKDRKDPVETQTITNSWIFPNCLKGRKTFYFKASFSKMLIILIRPLIYTKNETFKPFKAPLGNRLKVQIIENIIK